MHGTGTAATVDAVAGPTGYYMLGAHGALYGFGELGNGTPINNPSESSGIGPTSAAVDIDLTPFGTGYWITHENGRVFAANNSLRDTNNPIQASYVDPAGVRRGDRRAAADGRAGHESVADAHRTRLLDLHVARARVPVRRRARASVISRA